MQKRIVMYVDPNDTVNKFLSEFFFFCNCGGYIDFIEVNSRINL